MCEPRLYREATPPAPRGGQALGALAAGLVMFAAVAMSAVVVHAPRTCPAGVAGTIVGPAAPGGPPGALAAWEAEMFRRFHEAFVQGDDEAALDAFEALPPESPIRASLWVQRSTTAERYFRKQLELLGDEVDRGACDGADERLARLARLLPEREIPVQMADCPSPGRDWSAIVARPPARVPAAIPVELVPASRP